MKIQGPNQYINIRCRPYQRKIGKRKQKIEV